MKKPMYILDLEGTTGIYSSNSHHINDRIKLKQGFRRFVELANRGHINMAIATRAPGFFVEEIRKNLKRRGINLNCPVYPKEKMQFSSEALGQYKDYEKIYRDNKVFDPASQAVIVGDFLRLPGNNHYSAEEFREFDFAARPLVLSTNFSLHDHPFPSGIPDPEKRPTPVYAVVPGPTIDQQERLASLDMMWVYNYLQSMYELGKGDFSKGFEALRPREGAQKVVDSSLAKRVIEEDFPQRYLIMKGQNKHWKPLERVM